MGIKDMLIKKYLGFKIKEDKIGRMTLKFSEKIDIQQEFRKYDSLIERGAKLLKGIESLNFDYMNNSIVIIYSPILDSKKVFKWAEIIIDTLIKNIDYIKLNWEDNIDEVVNKIESELISKKSSL